ncbi:MAG: rhodanese-like domain-containing protein [Maritimibacter sp.]
MMLRLLCGAAMALVITQSTATAQEVRITPDASSFSIQLNGEQIEIERIQDTSHKLSNEFSETSRPCPPFCIHPISAAPGVSTVGELEVIDFLEKSVAAGKGLLLDTRLPEWYTKGTIPGSVNVPFATLQPENPYRDQILQALGGLKTGDGWDFASAKELTVFCNGPWCDQSPRAIQNLLDAGYPAEKLKYYRGGMQVWMLMGLSVKQPNA